MVNISLLSIAHLDMDAFYASVELLKYPELKGIPVVVGGRSAHAPAMQANGKRIFSRLHEYIGRGVITTATYEARALGVFSGMGLMKAAKLAPDAVLLPADFPSYRHYSRLFKQAVVNIAPNIEDRGIDEIYIDFSDLSEAPWELAKRIKQAVQEATGLSCSIGLAPNKLLAKISSDLEKPNGLTIICHDDIPERIWPLPVRKINGIGPKAAEKLSALDIHTIGELAHTEPDTLLVHFGRNYAAWLQRVSHGIDDRPVITHSDPKSLSRETTFERDLHARLDREQLSRIFTELCEQLASDLQRKNYVARTVGIKLRYEDFSGATRDFTLSIAVSDFLSIRRAAGNCLKRVPLQKKLRLIGVRVSSISKANQLSVKLDSFQKELPFFDKAGF